ncbi:hypothetical protein EHRUM3_05510, partial [Ehrlichia ruminantium]
LYISDLVLRKQFIITDVYLFFLLEGLLRMLHNITRILLKFVQQIL